MHESQELVEAPTADIPEANLKRILIVEDEFITARDLKASLLKLGYEVIGAVSRGQEAILKAHELHPDLILMDITLKGPMNGIEAANEIWNSLFIPVIFLTAHVDAKTIDSAMAAEPFGYLPKPWNPNSLKSAVIVALHKSEADKRVREAKEELERYKRHLEDIVKERTAELESKNMTLQDLNAALRVLLKQRDDDRKEMEERFLANMQHLVLPYFELMKQSGLDARQRSYIDVIESHLHEIATPLLKNIRQFHLTPKEIKVATLIKQGKSTKEIAEILGVASGSIDVHRKNIRGKLGLSDRKINLQSCLESLAK